jgi:hypothetical protein
MMKRWLGYSDYICGRILVFRVGYQLYFVTMTWFLDVRLSKIDDGFGIVTDLVNGKFIRLGIWTRRVKKYSSLALVFQNVMSHIIRVI